MTRGANRWSRRVLFSTAVCGMASLVLTGCLSPTLPLPPPSKPTISSPNAEGDITITGVVQSRATVYAHNLRTEQIVGEVTGETGRYELTMAAERGDRISVWQTIDTDKSGTTEVVVPDTSEENANQIPPPPMGGASGEE